MSLHFPPDEALQRKAAAKLRAMLFARSFMERWEPVSQELKWVLQGRHNVEQHEMILPEYCYHIFDLYARTIYRTFTPISEVVTIADKEQAAKAKTVEEGRACIKIDWDKMGSVFSMGERAMMFIENEAERLLKKEGLLDLTPDEDDEVYQLICGDRWMKRKLAEFQALDKNKPVEEIVDERIYAVAEVTKKAIPDWHEKAREWEPGATAEFHTGVANGASKFINEAGELHGEKKLKLKNTYEYLLICWPEVEAMIKAEPPKRMEDLWNSLKPFSYVYWIEIQDLDQLVSLARPLKLKLKEPGAPRKL